MKIADEAVEGGDRRIRIFSARDVVDEDRRQLGEMGLRGFSFESARMPRKPAPHGARDASRVAETHLAQLCQRLLGVRLVLKPRRFGYT